MKVLKIVCIFSIIMSLTGAILGQRDEFLHSAYIDPNGAKFQLHWYDVSTPILAFVAMYCIVTINKSQDGTSGTD